MIADVSNRCDGKVGSGIKVQCVDTLLIVRRWLAVVEVVGCVGKQFARQGLEVGVVHQVCSHK